MTSEKSLLQSYYPYEAENVIALTVTKIHCSSGIFAGRRNEKLQDA